MMQRAMWDRLLLCQRSDLSGVGRDFHHAGAVQPFFEHTISGVGDADAVDVERVFVDAGCKRFGLMFPYTVWVQFHTARPIGDSNADFTGILSRDAKGDALIWIDDRRNDIAIALGWRATVTIHFLFDGRKIKVLHVSRETVLHQPPFFGEVGFLAGTQVFCRANRLQFDHITIGVPDRSC